MKKIIAMSALLLTTLWGSLALAFEIETVKVTDRVYALVGGTGARTFDNHAFNTTTGFVITDDGVVVIDSGASAQGAALIGSAIKRVTNQPLRWLINTGEQDHKWLGNSYFAARGVKIIALARTVAGQKKNADMQQLQLKNLLKERFKGTRPVYAQAPIEADQASLTFGNVTFNIIWPGAAHFPGDAIINIPAQKSLFTGDLVFMDRMLGVLPMSHAPSWQKAFHVMAALKPVHVIPGHGRPGTLAQAKHDTGDYLDWLIAKVTPQVENWVSLEDTVAKLSDAPFKYLRHYEIWHKTNVNRTYLQLEAQ